MRLGTALRPCSATKAHCQCARRYINQQSTAQKPTPEDFGDEALAAQHDFTIDTVNKTVKTAVGDLPLSPIMDPTYWEAVTRFQKLKPKPGRPQNAIEREAVANPFAQALATPLRMCTATKNRYPRFFLQGFNLLSHPETGQPWWVPRTLGLKNPLSTEEDDTNGSNTSDTKQETDDIMAQDEAEQESIEASPSEDAPAPAATENVQNNSTRINGPAAYVLARQDLLSSFVVKKSGFERHNKRIFGPSSSRYKHLQGQAVWREDMDTFMLGLMRQDIVDDLRLLSKMTAEGDKYYLVKCWGWDDIKYKHKGAVLWFGEADEAGELSRPREQPGPYATFDIPVESEDGPHTTTVLVHNMPMLLGAEMATELKADAEMLKDGELFMLAGRRTTNLQAKLWRLQGYLGHNKDILQPNRQAASS